MNVASVKNRRPTNNKIAVNTGEKRGEDKRRESPLKGLD